MPATASVELAQPLSLFLSVAVYESAPPAVDDCELGDRVTVGVAVVHVTSNVAVPVVVPLDAFVAVTPTVLVPLALVGGVAESVVVVDAPEARETLVLETEPVHPEGTDADSVNVADEHPLLLFVIVAV